jgi:hypothetical protein
LWQERPKSRPEGHSSGQNDQKEEFSAILRIRTHKKPTFGPFPKRERLKSRLFGHGQNGSGFPNDGGTTKTRGTDSAFVT